MKKTLVLLLILAVAGGIFAQDGEFSWSGGVDIGAIIDLNNEDAAGDTEVLIGPDGNIKGHVDLGYTLGGLSLGVGFAADYWDEDDGDVTGASIGLSADYTADRWGAHVEMDLFGVDSILSEGPTSLWGYYTFLDGGIRFDVSHKGGGNGIWAVSDIVLGEFHDAWDRLDGNTGIQFTFGLIEGLSFGFQFPFGGDDAFIDRPFVDNFFKNMLLGASFESGAIGVSFMLGLWPVVVSGDDKVEAEIHVGFSFAINDAMSVNADLLADVGNAAEEAYAAFGLGFNFAADPLSAGVTIKFLDFTDKFDGRWLSLEPSVGYQINDAVSVGLALTFGKGLGDGNKDAGHLEVNPTLSWAVADGASMNFGWTLGYDLDAGEVDANNITMGFSWSF